MTFISSSIATLSLVLASVFADENTQKNISITTNGKIHREELVRINENIKSPINKRQEKQKTRQKNKIRQHDNRHKNRSKKRNSHQS